ncbi:MAG: hypothetical protein COC12_03435 [Rhodobacteraceae bacterium]|nr:MAG: hypothetical protein COC12_03435 [Paracoccaceae bacterium]
MVPEGWEATTLDKVFKLASGSTKPTDVVAKLSDTTPNPVYGGNGVLGWSGQANHLGNVILIGRVGEYCGVTRLVYNPCWITDNALYTKDFFSGNDIEFVTYRLQYFDVSKLRSKGGQPLVSQKPIYGTRLALPPLPEQRKIADILSTWDRAIEVSESLLATARQQKRALMQTLLTGKRRFPEFEGQKWKEVRLGEVCETWSGGTPSRRKAEYYSGSIPWIKSGEVNAIRVEATEEHITEEALKCSSAKLVEPETVLIAMYGATAGVVSVSGIHAAINQAILAVKANAKLESNFLLFAVQGKMEDTKRITQGGQPNLNAQIIRAAKIPLPCLQEQRQIAKILGASQREIELGCQKIQKLRTEKRALMQQLLTGKRRVVV